MHNLGEMDGPNARHWAETENCIAEIVAAEERRLQASMSHGSGDSFPKTWSCRCDREHSFPVLRCPNCGEWYDDHDMDIKVSGAVDRLLPILRLQEDEERRHEEQTHDEQNE